MNNTKIIIDLGNTQTKVAVFSDSTIQDYFLFSDEELLPFLAKYKDFNSIISSVRNEFFTKSISTLFSDPLVLSSSVKLPIINKYKTPDTLGNDRIANAVAAWEKYPNQKSLVIDAGTCLKMDFINHKNEYIGGSISPGLQMRYKALNTLTDNLPLIEDVEINQLIGNDTKSSIQCGVYGGMVAEIKNVINQYEEKYSELNILLTGGDLTWFSSIDLSQKNSIFADHLITLKGLNTILDYNVQK